MNQLFLQGPAAGNKVDEACTGGIMTKLCLADFPLKSK
jgi:hypothetical protein